MEHESHRLMHVPIGAIVTVAIASAVCVLLVLPFVSMGWQFKQALKEFPKRHLEATQAIERAYAHFREHGRWPTKADLERDGQRWLPPGWEYESNPELGGPFMGRDGPWHLSLVYKFAPPQQGAVDNTWTLSVEGDKSTFPADVDYSLPSATKPRRP
jgi:hypothetical protein